MSADKSRLENMRVYLSGNCENAVDNGADWRRKITPRLDALGLTIFDPVHSNIDLSWGMHKDKQFDYVKKLRDEHKYEELSLKMKEVVKVDLRLVDCSDIIIVHLDASKSTTGTIDEIVTACNQKKPVYLCSKQGMQSIPIWLFGRIPYNYIFETLDEIIDGLNSIAFCPDEELPSRIDKRWMFVNKI